ncbi:SDR family NAD(P)-dependent oxidoreductase [Achromobacter aloeverae]|uniref:Short-chain dehydrogenase n=1 Tax=Achromobacter aloeverae TaxID=1750518 RepID=A0A4Q1HJ34_9BURK|nr:SDR family oxidoreductase [Achromobacter aloeverae]RXN88107.1 short-chain dehydrogenase [Achromobacter aloeverae]
MSLGKNLPLDGRVAIVTGAARNIGRATAVALGRQGASVVVNVHTSADMAEETAALVRAAGGQATVHLADVSQPQGARALVDAAVARYGRIDILVNNAAVRREARIDDLDWAQWREVTGVILDGAFLCAQAATPWLRQSPAGAIVNIGGMSAHAGSSGRAHVMAAKMGLVGLTRALAHDLADSGVTANCVVPGLIDTVRGHSATGAPAHHASHATLLGRRGTSEEVADLIVFLCGPQARYLTGQTLHANGGAYLG